MKVLTNLDLNKNQILNAVLQGLATAPENPREGQYYYNTADKVLYIWNGTAWASSGVKVEASATNGHILTWSLLRLRLRPFWRIAMHKYVLLHRRRIV